jgi:putative transposase
MGKPGAAVTILLQLLRDLLLAFVVPRTVLVAENLLLRHQVVVLRRQVKRPRLRPFDRWALSSIAGRFRDLLAAVFIVRPETVIRWHRTGWRLLWRWRSRRRHGRPPIDMDLRNLIRRMWRDNATWGEDMMSGELAKLGYRVSPRTVAKYRPSGLARARGQRWSTFIRNHLQETWACDYFTIVTVRFRVLYVFVVLSLGRRRIVHVGVTEHPTGVWSAQRLVEAVADTDHVPRFLVHDRDSIFEGVFRKRVRGLGVRPLRTPPRSPQSNAFCERVIGTIRRGCTDYLLFRDERHAEHVLAEYLTYYDGRPHRSLHLQPPDAVKHLGPLRPAPGTRIIATPILGGLHYRYGFTTEPETPRLATAAAA